MEKDQRIIDLEKELKIYKIEAENIEKIDVTLNNKIRLMILK